MYTIGIIGFGFVGKAIHHGFAQTAKFRIFDINPLESTHTLEEVATQSDFIFICVPTPTNFNAEAPDLSITDSVVKRCVPFVENTGKILILKSTILPGTTERYTKAYQGVRFVFNPEFLTERSARLDFINQSRIILGGHREDTEEIAKLYRQRFLSTLIFQTDPTSAEMVKYFANCFFSVKVSFVNEMYQICEKLGLSYNDIMGMVMADGRIGNSHWSVPGHDGSLGFGGKCFPKDLTALIHKAQELGVDPKVMRAAWRKNLEVRGDKDWLQIPGASSED